MNNHINQINQINPPRTHQANLSYCLILQSRLSMQYIPNHFIVYYINSKRRFFLYFKFESQLKEVMNIFDRQNVKYHRRSSLFPDREQLEQILYHCNFKHKQKDIRRNLKSTTILNQPKDAPFLNRSVPGISKLLLQNSQQIKQSSSLISLSLIKSESHQKQQFFSKNQHHDLQDILLVKGKSQYNNNQQILNNVPGSEMQMQMQMQIHNQNCQQLQQNNIPQSYQYIADFGHIKIKNLEVIKILQNKQLLKRLFQEQKLRQLPKQFKFKT